MTRSERLAQHLRALVSLLAAIGATTVTAQQPLARSEPAEVRIRTALRAFYFSLAHHDWEALTAGILPAKVVAHYPAPPAVVAVSLPAERPVTCAAAIAESMEAAEITIDAGWAMAAVARCGAEDIGSGEVGGNDVGVDEFRFVEFDGRWWIVHIELFHDPGTRPHAIKSARESDFVPSRDSKQSLRFPLLP
jgi:hypothetical protein